MMACVRSLLHDPETAQRGALDENNRAWFHFVSVHRDVMSPCVAAQVARRFSSRNACSWTLVVSSVVIPVLMVGFVNAGKRLSERLLKSADKTAKTTFTFPRVIEDGYTLSSVRPGSFEGRMRTISTRPMSSSGSMSKPRRFCRLSFRHPPLSRREREDSHAARSLRVTSYRIHEAQGPCHNPSKPHLH